MGLYKFELNYVYYEVEVERFFEQPALGMSADSDWDAKGYYEIDYTVHLAYDDLKEEDVTETWDKIHSEEEVEEKLIEMIKEEKGLNDWLAQGEWE